MKEEIPLSSRKGLQPVGGKMLVESRTSPLQRFWLRVMSVNISHEQRQYFLENMSMQLGAGLDLLQALAALEGDSHMRSMKRLVRAISSDVASGSSLSSALRATGLLESHVISLIQIGEESGKLAQNMDVLSVEQQKEREFQSRIRSAMFYPVFVLGLTMVIGLGVAWFILPNILQIFEQMDVPLPLPTRILIAVSDFFQAYGAVAVPGIIIGGILLVYLTFFASNTKFIGQRIMFSIPGIRRLMIEVEIARMGYVLGTLLSAGLPIVDALAGLEKATSLKMYQKLYGAIRERIETGESFQSIFQDKGVHRRLLPMTIQQVITSGEQSGALAEGLKKIGRMYENKTENTTKNVSVIIEPILLVIVWVGVVLVALSVVLPIYSLIGNFNTGTY